MDAEELVGLFRAHPCCLAIWNGTGFDGHLRAKAGSWHIALESGDFVITPEPESWAMRIPVSRCSVGKFSYGSFWPGFSIRCYAEDRIRIMLTLVVTPCQEGSAALAFRDWWDANTPEEVTL